MFMRNGEEFETVDAMNESWKGPRKVNHTPLIEQPVQLDGKSARDNITLIPQRTYQASIKAVDAENDSLSYEWVIMPETTSKAGGGDFEAELQPITGLIRANRGTTVEFSTPVAGRYRLYVFVRDGHNNIATANCSFLVN